MRLSALLGKTLRQPPSDANLTSHQLLVRAAHIRATQSGQFAYLPLGLRALARLQSLVRGHMAPLNGQEIDGPLVPGSGDAGALIRLVSREIDSHRQLPVVLLQRRTISADQPGSRLGLFGSSERPAIEVYAFGRAEMADIESKITTALDHVFAACNVDTEWARSGEAGRRALFSHSAGDQEWVDCSCCDYAAIRSWATTSWPEPPDEAELPTEEIATPGCDTIAALADFLNIPATKTLKMVFYSVEGRVSCIVIRGDRTVDEHKLARMLGTEQHYASLEGELSAIGAVGGFASPIGLALGRVRVVADPSVRSGANFVSGANQPDLHIRNVNVPRDFTPSAWVDLALIEAGDPCPRCGAPLQLKDAFDLAAASAPESLDTGYLDEEGKAQPLWWAHWRLDLGGLLAAIVEQHHDENGIVWPALCAPFDVHLVALDVRREVVAQQAQALYDKLRLDGYAVLHDDRHASAGVKFNDADLIGIPLRLTVSKTSALDGLVEAKWRDGQERTRLDDKGLHVELARLRHLQSQRGIEHNERFAL